MRLRALCVKSSHAHFYAEAKTLEYIAKMQQKATANRNPAVTALESTLERTKKTLTCLRVVGAQRLDGVPQLESDEHYEAPTKDMHHIRRSLHKQHRCPHARLGGPTHIVGLSMALGKKSDGRVTIHALPYRHQAFQQLCNTIAAYLGR